jgi:monofunctional biosynthetic peptidoglycan transglycosylase
VLPDPPAEGFGVVILRWVLRLVAAWLVLTVLAVLLMRWVQPLTSAGMLEASLTSKDPKYHTHYEWVGMGHISREAPVAVMASEDQAFPYHNGFDMRAIEEAVKDSENGRRLRGASTITQQVAKNLFLWSGRSFVRKGLEAYFTVLIEAMWPKKRILEVYLNIIELGPGVYGVEAASQHFYHMPAERLSAEDAALLAAVLPNPRKLHVDRPSAYVLSRRDRILEQMRELGGTAYLQALQSKGRSR